MKNIALMTMLVLSVFLSQAHGSTKQDEFVTRAIQEAMRVHKEFPNVPVAAIVAQSIYESNYGRSPLATQYNNYHGLKAYHWNGEKATVRVKEEGRYIKAEFRVFANMNEGFRNYCQFLQQKRYRSAARYKNNSVKFVAVILDAGFCPSDEYLSDIKRIMKRHNLQKYDSI